MLKPALFGPAYQEAIGLRRIAQRYAQYFSLLFYTPVIDNSTPAQVKTGIGQVYLLYQVYIAFPERVGIYKLSIIRIVEQWP